VEARLARIWEEVLDVRPIGVTDDFFDLGGHSLLAVRLIARIEARFGRKLPLAAFFTGATIEDLAALLREATPEEAWSPLVAIRPTGRERPFFCVHPIGGNVLCYRELAWQLGEDRPFYALEAAGLDGGEVSETRLEDMAARYIEAIREVQPEGPYHLGGWSFGGAVAFEMARQLRAQGQEVATLALIDSLAPGGDAGITSIEEIDRAWLQTAFVMNLAWGLGEDRWNALRNAGTFESVIEEIGPERFHRLLNVFKVNGLALSRYVPRVYPGRMILLQAGDKPGRSFERSTMGWDTLAAGGVSAHVIPGDHYSMMRLPAVQRVAEILKAEMEGNAAVPSPDDIETPEASGRVTSLSDRGMAGEEGRIPDSIPGIIGSMGVS
jgi:thioesterase domain-containing protein/acyl carrier protein